jgi:diadenosine tetraphosphate (Ap4A) HIT family hydrolase
MADLVTVVQSLVAEYHLPDYRLLVNGGEYQEFPHLHFHLISEFPIPIP